MGSPARHWDAPGDHKHNKGKAFSSLLGRFTSLVGAIENIMEGYNVDIEKRGTLNLIENCCGWGEGEQGRGALSAKLSHRKCGLGRLFNRM